MPVRRLVACGALALVLAVAGCGGESDGSSGDSGEESAATATPTPVPVPDEPSGIVALGHSGLTGHNADPAKPDQPAKEYSWATGTLPEIDSIYQRMIVIRPETDGRMHNAAVGGAISATLTTQAKQALTAVPKPAIVIILTIDNDIQCDGTDAQNVSGFGENVLEALTYISETAPESRILLVSFFGRPSAEDIEAITTERPDLKQFVTGTGECDWYSPDGELNEESIETFNAIVDMYEAEQERACLTVPQCRTDGGAGGSWEDDPIADYTDDFTHLNAQGLAGFAEHMWPVVQAALESP